MDFLYFQSIPGHRLITLWEHKETVTFKVIQPGVINNLTVVISFNVL